MHTPIVRNSVPQRPCIQSLANQEPRHCLVACSRERRYRISEMPTTVAGSLTMRSCRQFCQASAPMSLTPDSTLPQTRNPCKSPFWDDFLRVHRDMNGKRNLMDGATVELFLDDKVTLLFLKTTVYAMPCSSLSQIGSSRSVCVAVCKKSMEHPNTLRSVTEAR